MALEIRKPDDSALTGFALTVERAVPSASIQFKIINTGAEAVVGAFVTLYAETTPGSGIYRTDGQPVVDERMGRLELTGQDSSATPGQEIVLGQVQPMGHLAVALLPTLLPGDWVLGNFWLVQTGASAGGSAVNIKLEVANERRAYPLPMGVSKVGTGIDSGIKQARSYLIAGCDLTATGTPDDQVHVAVGSWLLEGEVYVDASIEDLTLDQTDGNGDTLTGGQSYIAVVTLSAVSPPTVTKGIKDTAPDRPTPPTGDIILGWVTVAYNGGGSVIGNTDIESDPLFGRYYAAMPASGLTVTVHSGEAVIADFMQVHGTSEDVLVLASNLNRIWLEWNGVLTVTQTAVPPSAGAVLLYTAEADSTDIVALTDTRTYIRAISAGSSSLTVKAVGGSPTVSDAVEIQFPDLSVTDHGAGVVEVTFPALTDVILKTGAVTYTGAQSMGSHKITNLLNPTSAQDAATKAYVDLVGGGGGGGGGSDFFKDPVRAATTGPGTLATSFENGDVIDGVTLATGDRILLKDQATDADNGIYVVAVSGAPARAADADTDPEVMPGLVVFVTEGNKNADAGFLLTTDGPITVGSTGLTFQQFSGGAAAVAAETLTLSTGTNNNVAIVNVGAPIDVVKFTASGNADLTGLVAPAFGQIIPFVSIAGSNRIRIKHASLSSSSANRILTPDTSDFDMTSTGEGGIIFYDTGSAVFRIVAVNFGLGASLSVTDGTTTVTDVVQITVSGGGVVNNLGGGIVEIDLSGLGGGGGGMGETKWEPDAIVTLLSTELDSLSNGNASALGSAYDNSAAKNLFADFQLDVTFGTAPTVNQPIKLYIVPALDGTNYGFGSSSAVWEGYLRGGWGLIAVTTQQRLTIQGIPLPPCPFKIQVVNSSGQGFPVSGSTVKMVPYDYNTA